MMNQKVSLRNNCPKIPKILCKDKKNNYICGVYVIFM